MILTEVVIYLDKDYKENESIFVSPDLTPEQITEKVNEQYGDKWFYYDINKK